jgi:CheY-like chemotaxis protein
MGNRLLLADDSITIQKVVAIIFANEEFELTVVDNGTAALEKAREIQPDVMLVDALMPGKTGYEVCAEIRRDPKLSSVPILLLIGAFEPLDEAKARDCGADSSISKPFESQQLIDRVKELLELGKTRSAAPAATAPLLEAAAEELWGDLSSFDTMPPVDTFAAPAPVAPAAQPVPAAPAAQPIPAAQAPSEPAAPAAFTAPAAPAYAAPVAAAPQPAPATPAFAAPREPVSAIAVPLEEQIVEVNSDDDLWGAFEMEELPPAATAEPAPVFGVEPDTEFEAEEFFSFDEESEEIEETGPALDLAKVVEGPVVQQSAEELFSFEEEPPFTPAPEPEQTPFQLPEFEPFEPEAVEPVAPVAAAPLQPVRPEPAREPVPPLEPQSVPVYQASVPDACEANAQAGAPGLSEADLIAALSKISREVIERIVWEVVPDLAEVLIKEEIRKLKAGVQG